MLLTDQSKYNPDILSCLANLSSDEVFTPPNVVNEMLDCLPQELWRNKNLKVLNPSCKSGVFLREIAKRLDIGLQNQIEDRKERFNHILKNQLFGIAITDLTGLIARRTVYCSKVANGEHSICQNFDNSYGNIINKRMQHTWQGNACIYCNASRKVYDRGDETETYAYNFIHAKMDDHWIMNQEYDLIIGGPPYQLYDGGGTGAAAKPVYQKFIEKAKQLNPRFLSMIIPARWYSGGKGLDDFRESMLSDRNIRRIVDYVDTRDCFPNVDIAGGICYFIRDREEQGDCLVTTIRNKEKIDSIRDLNKLPTLVRDKLAVEILEKVFSKKEIKMDKLVSSRKPFGLESAQKPLKNGDLFLFSSHGKGKIESSMVKKGHEHIDKWKVFLSKASNDHGGQADKDGTRKIFARIEVHGPKVVCTESYLLVGTYETSEEAENMVSYLRTKFCRFLVSTSLLTHNISKGVFRYVPIQTVNKSWNDQELYMRYNLNKDEIDFIESLIRAM